MNMPIYLRVIIGFLASTGLVLGVLMGFVAVTDHKNKNIEEKSLVATTTPIVSMDETKDLYLCKTKIGKIAGGRIFIDFDGTTYSFDGDLNGLSLLGYDNCGNLPSDWNHSIVYNNLVINLPKRGDLLKVTYVCDAPLSGVIFENCETNGKDRISEFEFGRGYLNRQYGNSWEKIFVKKIGDKNIVFQSVWDDLAISDSLMYADKPSKNPKDFNLVAVHFSDTTPEQLGVYPRELFSLYKRLRLYNLVDDMKIYENKLNYDSNEKWFEDLNTIRDKMVRTFHSKLYLNAIKNEKTFKDYDEKWNNLVNSFKVESQ
jgi:hypothetical protein